MRAIPVLLLVSLLACASCAPAPEPVAQRGTLSPMQCPAPSNGDSARLVFVYLPPSYGRPEGVGRHYPVVYLLHGGPGWPGDWFQHGHLDRVLDRAIAEGRIPETIAIAPDGRGVGRKGMSLWNSHPRVYLPIEQSGWAKCGYCGAEYTLRR